MAMTQCPESGCRAEISETARVCPKCGCNIAAYFRDEEYRRNAPARAAAEKARQIAAAKGVAERKQRENRGQLVGCILSPFILIGLSLLGNDHYIAGFSVLALVVLAFLLTNKFT
jgi:hypothetical protein